LFAVKYAIELYAISAAIRFNITDKRLRLSTCVCVSEYMCEFVSKFYKRMCVCVFGFGVGHLYDLATKLSASLSL